MKADLVSVIFKTILIKSSIRLNRCNISSEIVSALYCENAGYSFHYLSCPVSFLVAQFVQHDVANRAIINGDCYNETMELIESQFSENIIANVANCYLTDY